jgi:adenosylcobinamide kinase/adenosylcobinamide-phosphate guanylyltransferase
LKTTNIDAANSSQLKSSLTLVLGGVRSGKSRFAQDLAARLGGNDVLFVATAEPGDGEMKRRIDHHRQSRPSVWQTLERPLGTGRAIAETRELPRVVLVDCLTLLVSNLMCDGDFTANDEDTLETRVLTEVDALINVAANHPTSLLIVSGEVGSGVVPEHAMGRAFRDLLGLANQRIAASATATYWMIAGLAINATAIASTLEQAAETIERQTLRGISR